MTFQIFLKWGPFKVTIDQIWGVYSASTCVLWDYTKSDYKGTAVQVANYKDKKGQTIAQKIRFPNKDFLFLGDTKNIPLYGQWLWPSGGKMVTIVEGELDALSASQAQGNKWPTVSLSHGCASAVKQVRSNTEWLLTFDRVNIMFDMDDVGQEAARKVAELFPPRKAHIARLPQKDASDMLQRGSLAVKSRSTIFCINCRPLVNPF